MCDHGNSYDVEFVTIASIVDKLKRRALETPTGVWVKIKDIAIVRSVTGGNTAYEL